MRRKLEQLGFKPPLFAQATQEISDVIEQNSHRFELQEYGVGRVILREGDKNDCLFIVLDGQVEVVKRVDASNAESDEHRVSVLSSGDSFGELSVLDGLAVSATVRAITPVQLWTIDLSEPGADKGLLALRNSIQSGIGRSIAQRLRDSSQLSVEAMAQRLRSEQLRAAMGSVVIVVMPAFALYTVVLRVVMDLQLWDWMKVFGSSVLIVVFMASILYVIWSSPFPARFFGLTTQGWRAAVRDAVIMSAAFCLLLILAKFVLISFVATSANSSVFAVAEMAVRYQPDGSINWPFYFLAMAAYAALCPAQELVVRCGIQAPLYEFLQGSELKRKLTAIIISNLMMAATHSHLSLGFALATFLPGLFWGWLFTRHRNLFGVSVSHMMIGCFALFALGIEEFLE